MSTSGPLPAHPGRVIRGGCRAAGLSVRDAAATLNLAEGDLADVLDGSAHITPDLALKLETAGWSNAPFWLRLQANYDLAAARRRTERDMHGDRAETPPAAESARTSQLGTGSADIRSTEAP